MPELRTETMTVNMGPQHPSTHGVLNLILELDGENIVSMQPTIGFLHTGIEKTAEQKKWQQIIPLVERMDYLGAQSNSLAFCLSVEKLLGVDMRHVARWWKTQRQRLDARRIESRTHAAQAGKALDHQRRAAQQDHRERDLREHQSSSREIARA